MKKLEGEKIYLKPLLLKHAATFVKWASDPEVIKYTSFKPPKTVKEQKEYIRKRSNTKTDMIYCIFLKTNHKFIGTVGVHQLDNSKKQLTIGLFIGDKAEWGKGYGTDVFKTWTKFLFEEYDAKKLALTVYKENIAAQKVYQKAGFKFKGTKEVLNQKTGEMQEEFYMELLPKRS